MSVNIAELVYPIMKFSLLEESHFAVAANKNTNYNEGVLYSRLPLVTGVFFIGGRA